MSSDEYCLFRDSDYAYENYEYAVSCNGLRDFIGGCKGTFRVFAISEQIQ